MQELSICLFNKMMQDVLWCHKRRMKEIVRRGLLPLFFHLSDQTQSVAEVRISYLATGTSIPTAQGSRGHPGPGLKAVGHLERVSPWGATTCVTENGGRAPLLPHARPIQDFLLLPLGLVLHRRPEKRGPLPALLPPAGPPPSPAQPRGRLPEDPRLAGAHKQGTDSSQTCPACSNGAQQQQPMASKACTKHARHTPPSRLPSCPCCSCQRPGLRAPVPVSQGQDQHALRELGACRGVQHAQGAECQLAAQPGEGKSGGKAGGSRGPVPAAGAQSSATRSLGTKELQQPRMGSQAPCWGMPRGGAAGSRLPHCLGNYSPHCLQLKAPASCAALRLLNPAKHGSRSSPTALSPNGLGKAHSPAKRWGLPGPLPWAVVPSLSLCCSAGLCGSPCHRCRLPEAQRAQAPGPDRADLEDRRVLGKDNALVLAG